MRQPFPRIAVGALVAGLACSPALAFDVPDGQSCGGLACDLGLFGHKMEPKPAAPPAAVAPASPVEAAPIAERKATPAREPHKVAARRKTHAAKAVAVPAERKATAALGTPPLPATLAPAPASLAPPPAAPSPIAAVLAPPPPAPPVPVTAPVRQEATVLANPYVYTRPLPFMFQSVDPTQGVQ